MHTIPYKVYCWNTNPTQLYEIGIAYAWKFYAHSKLKIKIKPSFQLHHHTLKTSWWCATSNNQTPRSSTWSNYPCLNATCTVLLYCFKISFVTFLYKVLNDRVIQLMYLYFTNYMQFSNTLPSVVEDAYLNNCSKQHIARRNILLNALKSLYRILWKFLQQIALHFHSVSKGHAHLLNDEIRISCESESPILVFFSCIMPENLAIRVYRSYNVFSLFLSDFQQIMARKQLNLACLL